MFKRIRASGQKPEGATATGQLRRTCATDAGMLCLWSPAAFGRVHDYASWDGELGEDADILGHISAGHFVPIDIGSDGAFEVELRLASDAGLTDRERRYLAALSEPYRFVSRGEVCVSGIEYVTATPDEHVGRLPLESGEYSVEVHLIAWDNEPDAVGSDGLPVPGALPDFIVQIVPRPAACQYRTELATFSPAP